MALNRMALNRMAANGMAANGMAVNRMALKSRNSSVRGPLFPDGGWIVKSRAEEAAFLE